MNSMTVKESIIMHLSRYSGIRPDVYYMPFSTTQDGIAAALGITRAHASIVLKRLTDNGEVSSIIAHTPHNKRKRKTYFLKQKGRSAVPGINERLRINEVNEMKCFESSCKS